MNRIDYALISQAIGYYESQGFRYIEVPWVVSEKALLTTLPEGKKGLSCADGALVGSAEQSFIHLAIEGKLSTGRYVAASPCFRDDTPDEWHQRTFFKVELIHIVEQPRGWPDCFEEDSMPERQMAEIALGFFQRFEPSCVIEESILVPPSPNGVPENGPVLDITLGGVELGSYGTRGGYGFAWTFGTGLAEPRFSMARANLPRT